MVILQKINPSIRAMRSIVLAAGFSFIQASTALAATVVSGSMTVNYNQTAFGMLGLTQLNEFNQAISNSSPRSYIMNTANAGDTTGVWTGLPFAINGASLSNPTGRSLQTTSLSYDPASFSSSITGQIGLGGVSRFDVSPLVGGGLFVLGDYSLHYSAARAGASLGGETTSGWYLANHFDIATALFDLTNVTTSGVSGSGFNLSGDLMTGADSGLLYFGASSGQNYGSFSLNADAVPEPSRALLLMLGITFMTVRRKRPAAC